MNKLEILDIIKNFKEQHYIEYGIIYMGIFGSLAREQIMPESDIDVFVKTNEPNPFILVSIKEQLELIFNKKVDVIRIRDNMNPYLKQTIEKDGIYV